MYPSNIKTFDAVIFFNKIQKNNLVFGHHTKGVHLNLKEFE